MKPGGRNELVLAATSLVFAAGTILVIVVMFRLLPFWWWGPPALAITAASGLALGYLTGDGTDD